MLRESRGVPDTGDAAEEGRERYLWLTIEKVEVVKDNVALLGYHFASQLNEMSHPKIFSNADFYIQGKYWLKGN